MGEDQQNTEHSDEIKDNSIEQPKEELSEEVKETNQTEEKQEPQKEEQPQVQEIKEPREKKPFKQAIIDLYKDKYKKLLIIPFTILILALILISIQIATTGDFVEKDVSLKGGITITIYTEKALDLTSLENYLDNQFPNEDLSVRALKQLGKNIGIIIDGTESINAEEVIKSLESQIGEIKKQDYTTAAMGSSLGATFFKETLKAIYISFLFMGIVVFWYFGKNIKIKILSTLLTIIIAVLIFYKPNLINDIIAYIIGITLLIIYIKTSAPSFMVILNVFSDLIVTLAIVNILQIKLSTAGIAAFLMIIGYSVDTNILLSTKLIKRKEGAVIDRLFNAMKTGLTMSITTLAAVIIALIFTQSSIIKQIMVILLIGLLVDMLYTWIQNAGILRMYLEKQQKNE